ncbi:MAG: type II toxin-antitoxin system VapC family toxin, partial [Chloroflexi bacterium]|nr:type II toxin-antitoxin system VapC family toxin [Chloroflexota bacterium]
MEPTPSLAVPQFVVDASVATKWYLNDEEFADEALKVLLDFQEERITLIAPEHIRYEVPSAIRNAIRTDRIDPEKAWEQVRLFLQLRIPVVRTSAVIELGLHASLEYGCSFYDGLYLAL